MRITLIASATALLLLGITGALSAQEAAPKKVLFLTKSAGFQHSVIARDKNNPNKLAHLEQILVDLGGKNGFEVTCTKDASLFNEPATLEKYDVFAFYTTGDLTRTGGGGPGMSPQAKQNLLKAIEAGKGVLGIHSATDTFPSKSKKLVRDAEPTDVDPYIAMIGGEFAGHGSQQKATMKLTSPAFPGLENLQDFTMHEEWYSFTNLAPDMHVILLQDTSSMPVGKDGQRERYYRGPSFPATWARLQGDGRVFYTSIGHREDVCLSPIFQQVLLAGLNWTSGKTQFDPKPNLAEVAPLQQP